VRIRNASIVIGTLILTGALLVTGGQSTLALDSGAPARLAAAPTVTGQLASGDRVMGEKLAQEWCSGCHAVDDKATQARDAVPSFFSIAMMPSTTSTSLHAWLQTSHPRMPNWELTRAQIDDVTAYILSMKQD
jgi:mono/diheme cytochrome c family protein